MSEETSQTSFQALQEAISASLFRQPSKTLTKIAKKIKQSVTTLRQIELTRDINKFVTDTQARICEFLQDSKDPKTAVDEELQGVDLLAFGTDSLFGIRNTILTGNPATASRALRPDFFKEKGRKVRLFGRSLTGFPFSARKHKDVIIEVQIRELLAIWAFNECVVENEETILIQYHTGESKNYERKANVFIFGLGKASEFVTLAQGFDIFDLEERAMAEALEKAEAGLKHFETSPNWAGGTPPWINIKASTKVFTDWDGPDVVDEIEGVDIGALTFEWRIEAVLDDKWFYGESSDGVFERNEEGKQINQKSTVRT